MLLLMWTLGIATPLTFGGDCLSVLIPAERFLALMGRVGGYNNVKQLGVTSVVAGHLLIGDLCGAVLPCSLQIGLQNAGHGFPSSLHTLLEAASPLPNATKVRLHGVDNYTDTIPLAKALDPGQGRFPCRPGGELCSRGRRPRLPEVATRSTGRGHRPRLQRTAATTLE